MLKKYVEASRQSYAAMPFRTQLSFEPLYRRIQNMLDSHESVYTSKEREMLDMLERSPGMLERSLSSGDVERHADDIALLMQFVFPALEDETAICKAYQPFTFDPFFTTTKFRELLGQDGVEMGLGEGTLNKFDDLESENLFFAYTMLFDIHYKVDHVVNELVMKIRDTKRNLDRYFTVNYSFQFVDVDLGGLPLLPKERYSRLLIMRDLETLRSEMPLDRVTFYGFNICRYIEVTERENISQLKSELVERDALNDDRKFSEIVRRLRSVLQLDDLKAGLVFRYRSVSQNHHCIRRSLFNDHPGGVDGFLENLYGTVCDNRSSLFFPDIDECRSSLELAEYFQSKGIRSLGLIPLVESGKTIAVLELTSRHSEAISSYAENKLADLLPVLTIAVRQEMDEFESRIERAIKTHCTAIHPSVEWRFVKAATRYLNSSESDANFEDIVFEDVYPLYGSMDIRSSSRKRIQAIQADLVDHLALISETLRQIDLRKNLPVADYYLNAVGKYEASVQEALDSGDEISVIEFLQGRVEPFFEFVRENEPDLAGLVDGYFHRMAPGMGVLNRRRREYEESVALLNDSLSRFMEKEQEEAQAIFPHYFEKYRTDGVEYNMYVGQSMTHGSKFEEYQLKNLRLWQLMSMCRMTRLADSLTKVMSARLSCTPLILAHSAPLTIQFRVDEKRFEVEGSYNVRYEIIKKRIDKSTILDTRERLTQPGMLSVIYTQEKEREEYLGYFEYLRDKQFIQGDVEHLLIEDQEGVHGLRALRAKVAGGQ